MRELIINGLFPLDGGASLVLAILGGFLFSYLLGSVNFSILLTRLAGKPDIRTFGSGNAGATNMLRTYGKKLAILTLFLDMVKGAAAAFLGLVLLPMDDFAYVCVFFCLLGHAYPCYFGFRGGKAVATSFGAILVLNPIVGILLVIVFFLVAMMSHYVSVASMLSLLLFPLLNQKIPFYSAPPFFVVKMIVSVLIPALVIFLHRKNIVRLLHGEEAKMES